VGTTRPTTDFEQPSRSSFSIKDGSALSDDEGAEHDQQFILDIGEELEDREAGDPRDDPEHHEHKQRSGDVERRESARSG